MDLFDRSGADCVLALTTLPASFDAAALARDLMAARLAACVHIVPGIESVYFWQGAVHHDREQQVVIKTTRARTADLWTALKAKHPYDTPEFVIVAIEGGSPDYLAWITEST